MNLPNMFGLQKGVSGTTASRTHYSNLSTAVNTLLDANSSTFSQTDSSTENLY